MEDCQLAIIPYEGGAAGEKHSSLVEDWLMEGNGFAGELVVSCPENGTDAVPASVAKATESIEIRFHSDVVLEEVWICAEAKYAVYRSELAKTGLIHQQLSHPAGPRVVHPHG